jgi:hypothetical protein
MAETARYRNKVTQSGIFFARYRTEMADAGMPMPALVFWMPMPTYVLGYLIKMGLPYSMYLSP